MNVLDMFRLDGQVALVTGGAGILGQSIVTGLAEAGAEVITASRSRASGEELANELEKEGLTIHVMTYDQSDHDSIVGLKKQIADEFGRLDIFVNNAVARPMKSYDGSIEDMDLSMRVNATGAIDILREMSALMAEGSGGSIINISSMMGMFGPDLSNYEGTDMGTPPPDYFFHKGGMINLTRYFVRVLAGQNIRVNTVSPGGIFTHQPERFLENYCKKVPLGKLADADDFKGVIVLLASDAGAYINGENILVDGGLWS
ncbi:SDR family oxidoreductase [Membranicola marinus]|uniref:SDR family oxidoreductase n=1 Tax=Membranihabitans marinus TaxID=1227546 RepID=A0A953LBN1_9BACT|nr:SDR family oxidoreductase [Membranihabitans marinus]MBY5958706.1 SDR family oxidoreductase [Membranihabitans marinus]